jgi:hypothetical protein
MMVQLVLKLFNNNNNNNNNNTCHTVTSSRNLILLRPDRLTMYTTVTFSLTVEWYTFSAQSEHEI